MSNGWNSKWRKEYDYPKWGDTDIYRKTIGGYLLLGKHPDRHINVLQKRLLDAYTSRSLKTCSSTTYWKGWLCLASQVLSNTVTDRGLPISCFRIDVAN